MNGPDHSEARDAVQDDLDLDNLERLYETVKESIWSKMDTDGEMVVAQDCLDVLLRRARERDELLTALKKCREFIQAEGYETKTLDALLNESRPEGRPS